MVDDGKASEVISIIGKEQILETYYTSKPDGGSLEIAYVNVALSNVSNGKFLRHANVWAEPGPPCVQLVIAATAA